MFSSADHSIWLISNKSEVLSLEGKEIKTIESSFLSEKQQNETWIKKDSNLFILIGG